LRSRDQCVAAALLAVSLAAIAGWIAWQHSIAGRLIDIERAEPIAIETKIDINAADWPELALLPEIGPALAQRIVEDRRQRGPFASIDDLDRVRGIGPRTLEAIRPYLLAPAPPAAAANKVDAQNHTPLD
jgi:competence protein ComEA